VTLPLPTIAGVQSVICKLLMTTLDIENIEKSLDILLPEYYKKFMFNYPLDFANESTADYELISYPEKLIEENINAYKDLWGKQLNKQYFIIGENGCGDYFLIDLDQDNGVFSFFHDNQSFYIVANSLIEYALKIPDGSFELNWGNEKFKTKDLRK